MDPFSPHPNPTPLAHLAPPLPFAEATSVTYQPWGEVVINGANPEVMMN